VHAFVNDLERSVGTYLFGRRMYETMAVWETMDDPAPVMRDYAEIWRGADKVVYSRTLAPEDIATARTRVEHEFDPDAVRALKESAAADLGVGGPGLAASALHAGLVDEIQMFVVPVIVGGGTRALPDGLRAALQLLDERRFAAGFAYLRYRVSA
jgi:dihydrofolate reductase